MVVERTIILVNMDESKEAAFEYPPDLEVQTTLDLDEVVRRSVEHFGSPSAMLDELVASVPDDELADLAGLVQRVDSITLEYLDGFDEERCWVYPLYPDFTRAEAMADGRFRVPVADRQSLQRFLQASEVSEALGTYYSQYLQDEDYELIEEDEIVAGEARAPIQSQIDVLPVTVKPIDASTLFGIAAAYYWSEQGTDKYIGPADTLEDIAKDAPPEMLIPLILAIEEHFPREVDDDGCYKPVVWTNRHREYMAENGVVWEVYGDRDLRWQVEFACEADQPALNRFHGFNGDRFDEDFYETLAHLSRDEADKFGEGAVDTLMEEQHRRYDEKYGWLFRLGTKAS